MNGPRRYLYYGVVFLVVFSASVAFLGPLLRPGDHVVVPHIDPVNELSPSLAAMQTFPFGNRTTGILIHINNSVYQGARRADKEITVYGNVPEGTWTADTYRAMIFDPAQDEFFHDLTGKLRAIRAERGLSDDEYLELMAVYVQSLRYETVPGNPTKFPVETAMDRAGDCDDKSLLLAGLLSREGYRAAILAFGPENHTAVGVGSENYLYRNTGYAFIETTNFSYVGVPTTNLTGGQALVSDPSVIPIGNGTRVYTSGDETQFLEETRNLTKNRAEALEPQVKRISQELEAKHVRIGTLESQMAALRSRGDLAGYNARVSELNALVSDYNAELSGFRPLFLEYQNSVKIHNRILLNITDRKGVYEYVKTQLPATSFPAAGQ
jgi:hypothetical protein